VGRGGAPRHGQLHPAVDRCVDAPSAFRRQLLDAIPRLRRYARSLSFDAATADDLTQQVLERALSRWRQYDPRRDLAVWLLAIAHNAHMDSLRRESRMTVTDPEELQRVQDERGTHGGTDVGLRLDLLAALAALSPEQREPLLLVCVEQMSYAEVAEVLQIPVGTVMSRVFRGRSALRSHLEGPGLRRPPQGAQLKRVV
jgi:RNA polymerase sigma-70 factor, ECF subfamily